MAPPGPQIYLSATPGEIGFMGDAVEATLRDLGACPVFTETTGPRGKSAAETIRARLENCRAVIHIAGYCAGPEDGTAPTAREHRSYAQGRRSHAQLEYDLAVELGKELHVFVCAEHFPEAPPEPAELSQLQRDHRARLMDGTRPYRTIHNTEELLKLLRPLGSSIKMFARSDRHRLPAGLVLVIGLIILAIIAASVWWQVPRPQPIKVHSHRPGIPPSQDPK